MPTRFDWNKLLLSSIDEAADKVLDLVQAGDLTEAANGIMAFVEAMSVSDDKAMVSLLTQIATHIFKIMIKPDKGPAWHWNTEINAFRGLAGKELNKSAVMRNKVKTKISSINEHATKIAYGKLKIDQPRVRVLPYLTYEDIMDRDYYTELVLTEENP